MDLKLSCHYKIPAGLEDYLYLHLRTDIAPNKTDLVLKDAQDLLKARISGYNNEAQIAEYFLDIRGVEHVYINTKYNLEIKKGVAFSWEEMVPQINSVLEAIQGGA